MLIFTWIVLGPAGLLLAASGVCWGLFIALDDSGWQRLGVKAFRIAMVCLLFYINVVIYRHVVGVFIGTAPAVPTSIIEDE